MRRFCTLVVLLFAACAYRRAGVPTQHIVMLDNNGKIVDPTGSILCHPDDIYTDNVNFIEERRRAKSLKDDMAANPVPAPTSKYSWQPCNGSISVKLRPLKARDESGYFHDLFREMDSYFVGREKDEELRKRDGGRRRITLIIHGGLNSNHGTIERAQELSRNLRNDGRYPIFINWQASLTRSLGAHLFTVRHGDDQGLKSAPLAPLYLGADVATGYARAPLIWIDQIENDVDRVRRRYFNHRTRSDDEYCALRQAQIDCNRPDCRTIDISKGPFQQTLIEGTESTARYSATGFVPLHVYASAFHLSWPVWTWIPARYVISPLLYGLGAPAWDEMERHATLGFHGRTEASTNPGQNDERGAGGLTRFLKALQEHIGCTRSSECQYEITIIGHSMGTIVENHILRDFDDLPIRDIVYMAAASSVRDYEDSGRKYLERHLDKLSTPHIHHLMLNDFAEIRDQYGVVGPLEFPPSGSLLVWIDNYFTRPPTLRDRTAGRFDNLMLFLGETDERLRSYITAKTFGVGRSIAMTDPQHHGDFFSFDGNPQACIDLPQNAIDCPPPDSETAKNMRDEPCLRTLAVDEGNEKKSYPAICRIGHPYDDDHCVLRVQDERYPQRSCIYAGRFWRPEFWKPEKEDRKTMRPACLLHD